VPPEEGRKMVVVGYSNISDILVGSIAVAVGRMGAGMKGLNITSTRDWRNILGETELREKM
jgi:hypothetical protein